MTAQDADDNRAIEEPRMLRAQVEIVGQSLPMVTWINPTWAFLSLVPFLVPGSPFGHIATWRLITVMLLHLATGVVASILSRRFRADSSNTRKWLGVLTAFQLSIGAVWGVMIWLLWINGNAVNNVYVLLPISGVVWSYALSRTQHMGVYLAAILPIMALGALRAITGEGLVAHALAWAFPLTFGYTLILALLARRNVTTMLVTRFANDDMAIDLRHAHDEAIRKRFEAESANASKTTFLANMSHELRTPLNAILGFSDIIANERLGEVGTRKYKEYAHDINASGSHLLSIINDILDIAKIESGKMEIHPAVLDPREAIDSALKVVAGRARERRQTLNVHLDDDMPMPFADARAMKQIIINLVGNAIKFTQEEGTIDIYGRRADGGFELCVTDNGPGIQPEMLGNIFTPFNQVDNRYNRANGGTGLGLSLVRGLAELHGGKAWIESEVGAGVRAHVYFPVANAPEQRRRGRALA